MSSEPGSAPASRSLMMVTLQVRAFDDMVAWYRDVLGLRVQWLEPGEFCSLGMPSGGPGLALATDHPERIGTKGHGWMPVLAVADFDATVAALRANGVVFDAEEEGGDEGYRLVRVLDPEGNAIGLAAARS